MFFAVVWAKSAPPTPRRHLCRTKSPLSIALSGLEKTVKGYAAVDILLSGFVLTAVFLRLIYAARRCRFSILLYCLPIRVFTFPT